MMKIIAIIIIAVLWARLWYRVGENDEGRMYGGRWIDKGDETYVCNWCGNISNRKHKYCPNCAKEMKE